MGIHEHALSCSFQAPELCGAMEWELFFFWRHDMKQQQFVMGVAKLLESRRQGAQAIKTIAQNDDQTAASHHGQQLGQDRCKAGFATRLTVVEQFQDALECAGVRGRVDTVSDLSVVCQQSHRIPLLEQQVGQGCRELGGIVKFAQRAIGVRHASRSVHHQMATQIRFLFEFLDVVLSGLAICTPVNMADFVTRVVLSMFDEFDAGTFEWALVLAHHKTLDQQSGHEFEIAKAAQGGRVRQRSRLNRCSGTLCHAACYLTAGRWGGMAVSAVVACVLGDRPHWTGQTAWTLMIRSRARRVLHLQPL